MTVSHGVKTILQRIQSKLAFEDWVKYSQFSTKMVRSFGCSMFACLCGSNHSLSLHCTGPWSRSNVVMYIGNFFGVSCLVSDLDCSMSLWPLGTISDGS